MLSFFFSYLTLKQMAYETLKHSFNFGSLGSVWIQLILLKLKTENWKHHSKIIFKYMNSIVRPILMKKLLESGICESVNSAPCTVHRKKVNKCRLKKKKEKKRGKCRKWKRRRTNTKTKWVLNCAFNNLEDKGNQGNNLGWKNIIWQSFVAKLVVSYN